MGDLKADLEAAVHNKYSVNTRIKSVEKEQDWYTEPDSPKHDPLTWEPLLVGANQFQIAYAPSFNVVLVRLKSKEPNAAD